MYILQYRDASRALLILKLYGLCWFVGSFLKQQKSRQTFLTTFPTPPLKKKTPYLQTDTFNIIVRNIISISALGHKQIQTRVDFIILLVY